MHYFSTQFLVSMADKLKQQGQYHIAHKNIPSKDGPLQVSIYLHSTDNTPCTTHDASSVAFTSCSVSLVAECACI